MMGTPQHSTGALLSTKIKLIVDDPSGKVTLNKWTRTLRAVSTTKKPVGKDCHQCSERYDVLSQADIITKPTTYHASDDNFVPFQFLFEGHLPATTHSPLGSVYYELLINATTSNNESISFTQPLNIQRAVPEGVPKASIRIFPPTNLTGRVQIPPVVHPIGTFPITMTLSGVVEKRETSSTRWRLRKMMWRVEEHYTSVSTPCSQHVGKVKDGKAIQYTDTATLGNGELKTGWKTDFDTIGGEIYVELDASVATSPKHKAICDVESQSGMKVNHNLVIELIVAEEFVPHKNSQMITPTGAARVLRMQFALNVTQRAGMGISWDEEMPPMYEDVPDSPPGYGSADKNNGAWGGAEMLDYNGPPLEYTELERLPSTDPDGPPVYRERAQDLNDGLPIRSSALEHSFTNGDRVDQVDAGPSGTYRTRAGWTIDELEEEPQTWRRRQSSNDSQARPEPDYAEGEAT
jgi:arrestin-related trafficking adapter 1